MKRGEIPCILYLYLHYKIYQRTNGGNLISGKEARRYLHHWKIPKTIRYLILKEMEKLGLIKKQGKHYLKFNKPKFEINKTYDYNEAIKIIPKE